jgi:hypothetical protein
MEGPASCRAFLFSGFPRPAAVFPDIGVVLKIDY